MLDCDHITALIAGSHSPHRNSTITVCRRCGEFTVSGDVDGHRFSEKFSLYGSYELLAASQAYRHLSQPESEDVLSKRIWKPLTFANQRLYHVERTCDIKEEDKPQRTYRDHHLVFADSPSEAAAWVEKTYEESYKANPLIVSHWSTGSAVNVLQPLAWTVNGINLMIPEFDESLFVPDEFVCPQCHARFPAQGENVDCPNGCIQAVRLTWRSAAAEAGAMAQYWKKRAEQLEKAWPDEGFELPESNELEPVYRVAPATPHVHDWHIVEEAPNCTEREAVDQELTSSHQSVVCECGAQACQTSAGTIHDLVEPEVEETVN